MIQKQILFFFRQRVQLPFFYYEVEIIREQGLCEAVFRRYVCKAHGCLDLVLQKKIVGVPVADRGKCEAYLRVDSVEAVEYPGHQGLTAVCQYAYGKAQHRFPVPLQRVDKGLFFGKNGLCISQDPVPLRGKLQPGTSLEHP